MFTPVGHQKILPTLLSLTNRLTPAQAAEAAAAIPLRDYACAVLLGLNVARAFVKVLQPEPPTACMLRVGLCIQ